MQKPKPKPKPKPITYRDNNYLDFIRSKPYKIKLTTVSITHEGGTYSATEENIVHIDDMMQLVRRVLLAVGFSAANIAEYIDES